MNGKRISSLILSLTLFLACTTLSISQTLTNSSGLKVVLTEEDGLNRNQEPVEIPLRMALDPDRFEQLLADPSSAIRVSKEEGTGTQEVPSQLFDLTWSASDHHVRAHLLFFADVDAHSESVYQIDYEPSSVRPEAELSVEGEGVYREIENEHFRIETDPASGQIDQIQLKFADQPLFRFEPGNMHWNPDFIIVPDSYPDQGYSWPAARNMEHPDYEIESGPLFFSIKRRQFVPGQKSVFLEVYYRFYAGKPWFVMESRLEAVRSFRTFAIRNDELAFGVGDFTHAGWRTESIGLHPKHRGEVGTIPLYDESRPGRHILGSTLSPWTPWLSYSHNERGYAVASLRLNWDNRNLLTGEPSPLANPRTVLSSNNGAPYWFRSLVYTPRRAHDEFFFDLDQEVINEMIQRIPRGSSYSERNVYYFYPFDTEQRYEPADQLYLKLTKPLQIEILPAHSEDSE